MIHFVNYKLTYDYHGRVAIADARSSREAEERVRLMQVSELESLSSESQRDLSVRCDPPIDVTQLALFDAENE